MHSSVVDSGMHALVAVNPDSSPMRWGLLSSPCTNEETEAKGRPCPGPCSWDGRWPPFYKATVLNHEAVWPRPAKPHVINVLRSPLTLHVYK